MHNPIDVYTPCAPGSLMRSAQIFQPGLWRISRRDSELYSVQIVGSGAWARCKVVDAAGRTLWMQPSTFTGSFWLGAAAIGGIIVQIWSSHEFEAANLTLNWREKGQDCA